MDKDGVEGSERAGRLVFALNDHCEGRLRPVFPPLAGRHGDSKRALQPPGALGSDTPTPTLTEADPKTPAPCLLGISGLSVPHAAAEAGFEPATSG